MKKYRSIENYSFKTDKKKDPGKPVKSSLSGFLLVNIDFFANWKRRGSNP